MRGMMDQPTLRIVDANANRAREALRVAEDYARFALDSTRLTNALKALRHRLRECLDGLGVSPEALLAMRDTPGDVGTALATAPELERTDAADVARAACKRAEEALRSLEEYGKTLDPQAARGIEAIRYAVYEVELQMFHLPSHGLAEARLYVLVDPDVATGGANGLVDVGRAALRGGAQILQLRAKHATGRELLAWARALREATREHDALLIVNDRPDIALLADADGVHLGADDLAIRDARRLLGHDKVVGGTANTVKLDEAAEAAGADYIGCGAVFASTTKPDRKVVGPKRVARVVKAVHIPVFAIGGIGLDGLEALRKAVGEAACTRVAVCASVVAAADHEAAARAFRDALGGPGAGTSPE